METYLVGGAVRDELLGRPVHERDWVVVGARPEALRHAGYKQVGREFPVFLHPRTGEEYALARTERKIAPGYRGFEVHAEPTVTLEDDLRRRDLTINAMARDAQGRLIDPFGGYDDLCARRLRHVSPAFAEDPVRILRVARFQARFAPLGFTVAGETMTLMRRMVEAGEADHLVAERVWQELSRALGEAAPRAFVETLRACGALARVLPEVDRLFGVPQPPEHHPEIDTGEHTLLVLDQAARSSADPQVRFAALCHDLGKGLTPREQWPRHVGHERRGVAEVQALCERVRAPRAYRELAVLACRYHLSCHRADRMRAASLLRLIERVDGLRKPERFERFLLACEADARGRTGREHRPYPQAERLRDARAAAAAIDARPFVEQGLQGKAIAEAMRRSRIHAIRETLGLRR